MSRETNKKLKSVVCAGIVTLVLAGCAKANLVNSNSIIEDNIEYYIQTDKSVYNLGENVEMLHRVTNLSGETVTFVFAYQQQCSFEVWDGETRIWGWPKLVNPAFSGFTLQPGELKEYLKDWDMMNDNGTLTPTDDFFVSPGIYDVSGQLMGSSTSGIIPESVSVPIQIIPEPAMIYYVDADAGGANNGSSWTDAYNYLQDALADANSGDEVRVAEGIYKPDQGAGITPGDRYATFQLINGVTIKGSYAGFGESDPNARDIELYETILSGDLGGNDVEVTDAAELLYEETREENSFHVVDGSGTEPTAILDGFLVVGGQAWSDEFQYLNEYCYGGGLYIMSGSPTVCNCRFNANTALSYGGGVHMDGNSAPVLVNCRFCGNSATDGGGLNSDYSSPILTGCTFRGNAACSYNADGGFGGGLYNFESHSRITNCIFTGNSSDRWGGAGGMCNNNSSVIVTNCTFANNWGGWGAGGGLVNSWSDLVLANCTFCGNSTLHEAGGVYNNGPGNVNISNCILWGNTPTEMTGEPPDVSYSNVLGGWTGQGNIDVDPLFVDAGKEDYHLLEDSPCIDAGDPNYVAEPNETDLDGRPRVIGGRIDMGAYEYRRPIRIVPRTVNLASKGKWITCYIRLGEDYDVADIDPNSVLLQRQIEPESLLVDEQKQVAIARFSRSEVQGILNVGEVEVTISGKLMDGTVFEMTDVIRVIDKDG